MTARSSTFAVPRLLEMLTLARGDGRYGRRPNNLA